MPVRNQNWYDLQATRRYPLDDRSTGIDDAGGVIRDDILVDCHIRFPETLGQYLFLQGVTVAPQLVTVVFGVSADLEGAEVLTVAAVSLPRTAPQNVNQPITALVDGVAGWVVFGAGLAEEFTGRYSTPIQTLVAQRCARPYRPLPVPSIGKLNLALALEGEVTMAANPPVTAKVETVSVDGEPIQAIVFRLEGTIADDNPLRTFLSPCAERPESGTCPKPPIETINGISPDCDGNINLVINGFEAYTFYPSGGVDIISDVGLEEACSALDNRRRRTPQDDCVPGSEGLGVLAMTAAPLIEESETIDGDWPESYSTLPLCRGFLGGSAPEFVTKRGLFVFEERPAHAPCSGSVRNGGELAPHYVMAAANVVNTNVSIFRNCASDWALDKTISTQLMLTADGVLRNGGLVLNYVDGPNVRTTYLVALIDAERHQVRLLRVRGKTVTEEHSAPFQTFLESWHYLSARPVLAGSSVVVTVEAGTPGAPPAVSFSVPVSSYGEPIGRTGFYAHQAYTYFNQLTIEG